MKSHDNESFLNEEYYIETIRNGEPDGHRITFSKLLGSEVGFPYPKDNAIRAFHRIRHDRILDGVTVELWRNTPALVHCATATNIGVNVYV